MFPSPIMETESKIYQKVKEKIRKWQTNTTTQV